MLLPYRSEFDPEVQGEGSIGWSGLFPFAFRLSLWLFPAMTACMWRPRCFPARQLVKDSSFPLGDFDTLAIGRLNYDKFQRIMREPSDSEGYRRRDRATTPPAPFVFGVIHQSPKRQR